MAIDKVVYCSANSQHKNDTTIAAVDLLWNIALYVHKLQFERITVARAKSTKTTKKKHIWYFVKSTHKRTYYICNEYELNGHIKILLHTIL